MFPKCSRTCPASLVGAKSAALFRLLLACFALEYDVAGDESYKELPIIEPRGQQALVPTPRTPIQGFYISIHITAQINSVQFVIVSCSE